jgi:ankyrin repeat protein
MVVRRIDEELRTCASEGNLGGVEAALQGGADVNAKAEFGDTALNLAAQHSHREVALRLLDGGAAIENRGGADMTPLMNAAVAGHVGMVRVLLERGARIGDDVLRSVQLKVGIFEENAEQGMVRPDAVEAWRRFLEFLIAEQRKQ